MFTHARAVQCTHHVTFDEKFIIKVFTGQQDVNIFGFIQVRL